MEALLFIGEFRERSTVKKRHQTKTTSKIVFQTNPYLIHQKVKWHSYASIARHL